MSEIRFFRYPWAFGFDVLQAFENKKQEIIAFLNEAKTNIDTEKVRKVTKKLFKASIWKGK